MVSCIVTYRDQVTGDCVRACCHVTEVEKKEWVNLFFFCALISRYVSRLLRRREGKGRLREAQLKQVPI